MTTIVSQALTSIFTPPDYCLRDYHEYATTISGTDVKSYLHLGQRAQTTAFPWLATYLAILFPRMVSQWLHHRHHLAKYHQTADRNTGTLLSLRLPPQLRRLQRILIKPGGIRQICVPDKFRT